MKPQKQLIRHDPENGKYGDCCRTCLACILDMEAAEVPHFYDHYSEAGSDEVDESEKQKAAWLLSKGYVEVSVVYCGEKTTLEDVLHTQGFYNPDVYYRLLGRSKIANHVVVCRGGEIVWDPGYSGGLIGPTEEGHFWVFLLVPISHTVHAINERLNHDIIAKADPRVS